MPALQAPLDRAEPLVREDAVEAAGVAPSALSPAEQHRFGARLDRLAADDG